jgi:putative oxidoreductase
MVRSFLGLDRFQPYLRSLMRVMVGFTFSQHGWQKFFGVLGGFGGPGNTADPASLMGIAGILETFGGALIILGLFTRPVAFLLSGEMAVGYFRTHAPQSFWPLLNGGEITVFYCFFFLWLASTDAGAWSLDRLLFRGKPQS